MVARVIENGMILTITKGVIKNGTVVIENGRIKAVGKKIKYPKDCEVIDASGCFVMPGMIDSHVHIGLWEEGIGKEGWDGNEGNDPVTPHLRVIDGINPNDLGFKDASSIGITTVGIQPGSTNVIGGQGVAVKTYGKTIDSMIVKNPIGIKVALGENPKSKYDENKKYPATRMGVAGLLRDYLYRAKEYAFRKRVSKNQKPEFDIKLEALSKVIEKEIPLTIHAHRADDIMTAIRIANEFGIPYTLEHCTEGYTIVDELKKQKPRMTIGPLLISRTKVELRNRSFKNAAILSKAGLKVSLITDHFVLPVISLPLCAALAVKYGMNKNEALKAITINPAEHLGISKRVGSIEPGKDADIVILDNEPLKLETNVKKVIINGEVVFES
jgi:imidazolonepropionase-like amidohydrolase